MKKIIMLSVLGFMATGMYANNNIEKSNKILLEKKAPEKQVIIVQEAKIIVNCEDGSSYSVSCSSCTSQQLVNIAMALCS